jgi:hypothetical protein
VADMSASLSPFVGYGQVAVVVVADMTESPDIRGSRHL